MYLAYAIPVEQLSEALASAAEQVLETMFFMTVISHSESAPDAPLPVCACLEFRGEPSGSFGINVSEYAARVIASNFLGDEPESLAPPQIAEVICELANMICGAVLTRVHGENLFELTSPEMQDPERALAAAARATSRTFDLGDGLLQVYLKVNGQKVDG
jgi:CheY-specific phosphatase CheX